MIRICIALLMSSLLLSSANAEVTIVASIKPLALISTAILGERGTVLTLVDAQQSPHDYAMKPSDRISIQQADILIWVSPVFELYLADIYAEKSRQKAIITFAELSDVHLLHETAG